MYLIMWIKEVVKGGVKFLIAAHLILDIKRLSDPHTGECINESYNAYYVCFFSIKKSPSVTM
jgi:hypothetical protein